MVIYLTSSPVSAMGFECTDRGLQQKGIGVVRQSFCWIRMHEPLRAKWIGTRRSFLILLLIPTARLTRLTALLSCPNPLSSIRSSIGATTAIHEPGGTRR